MFEKCVFMKNGFCWGLKRIEQIKTPLLFLQGRPRIGHMDVAIARRNFHFPARGTADAVRQHGEIPNERKPQVDEASADAIVPQDGCHAQVMCFNTFAA